MDTEVKRLSRLTAILIQLLSRRIVNATKLAEKFEVSTRTIYRDIKTLENAGVPIVTEEGKGYSLLDGYRIPPIMLTETEANALLTSELLIQSSRDVSLIEAFSSVSAKIKAVVPDSLKRKTELLEQKVGVSNTYISQTPKSNALIELQRAMLDHLVTRLVYKDNAGNTTTRTVEPFAVYANQNNDWVLVAYCRLRSDFRTFSLTGIENLLITTETFKPHKLTFEQYLEERYENKKRLDNQG